MQNAAGENNNLEEIHQGQCHLIENAVQVNKASSQLSASFKVWGAVTKDHGHTNVGFVSLDTMVCKTEGFLSADS